MGLFREVTKCDCVKEVLKDDLNEHTIMNSLDFQGDPSPLSHTDRSLAVGTKIQTHVKRKI